MADTERIAIVTGGAQGIGEAIANRLASEGFFVVIADLTPELGEAAAKRIGEGLAAFHRCDISDVEEVRQLFEHVIKTYGRIDVVVRKEGKNKGGEELMC